MSKKCVVKNCFVRLRWYEYKYCTVHYALKQKELVERLEQQGLEDEQKN